MAGDAVAELVSHADDLERQDRLVAQQLEVVSDLAARAGTVRARGAEVRAELDRIPRELEEIARRIRQAEAEADAAREQLRLADERLAALERARRRRTEEIARAEREAATARELLADAHAHVERLRALGERRRAGERALADEGVGLALAAAGIATELQELPRVGDAAARLPGKTLAELEQWGLLVRSALFVARGTLEAERERIVAEANALGATVLGETLGASSVALVRRRLEAELDS